MFKTIRTRLIVVTVIPLLFALVLTVVSVLSAYNSLVQMSELDSLVKLASIASAQVHETQKERGLTGGFMASGGKQLAAELSEQRGVADTTREALSEFLTDLDASVYGEEFEEALASAVEEMESIDDVRAKVGSQLIPVAEALTFYTDHNAAMLELVTAVSKFSKDAGLARSASAYGSFLQGKERAGLERAVMRKAFANDRFESGSLREFGMLVAQQDTFFRSFRELAAPDQVACYERELSGAVVNEVQRMRDIAFKNGEAQTLPDDFGIDASHWVATITTKINLMKEVDDRLASDLRSAAVAESERLRALLDLSVGISSLVHEAQKERGLTAALIGSGRTRFTAELAAQRVLTNAARAEFERTSSGLTSEGLDQEFVSALDPAVARLRQLDAHRTKVSDGSISDSEAIGFYTAHNAAMLDTIAEVAQATDDSDIVTGVIAYLSFLQGKERAGLERAVLGKTFAANRFESGTLRKFGALVAEQDVYFASFRDLATPEQVAFYDGKLSGAAVSEVQKMRDTAFGLGSVELVGFGVDARQWFDAITQKIDFMKKVEDELSAAMLSEVGSLRSSSRFWLILLSSIATVVTLGVLLLCYAVIRGIVRPLNRTVEVLKDIAEGEGDLTKRLVDTGQDEIGEMSRWFNAFMVKLQGIIKELTSSTEMLVGTAAGLSSTATELANGADEASGQSSTVASAAEEMTTTMNTMATSAEQMSGNVGTVASAVKEMTASISEIAKNAEQASAVAGSAAELASSSNENIGLLSSAADEIGKVIETIQDIAEQTNLLALNATIEAARAGEAGKGFAVVATEVKELAKQTAEATEDIRRRIEGIQGSTNEAVNSIGEISKAISEVNDVSTSIASAVEEQSVTTREIAQNITQTSSAAGSVSTGVGQSMGACQEITKSISEVDAGVKETARGATSTQAASAQLTEVATHLEGLVGQFLT
ncbi:MAG: methyl-accepting chemotaxis protein [bacterium]|nr:methyl-accepting chemotaxis protein [bacterium]